MDLVTATVELLPRHSPGPAADAADPRLAAAQRAPARGAGSTRRARSTRSRRSAARRRPGFLAGHPPGRALPPVARRRPRPRPSTKRTFVPGRVLGARKKADPMILAAGSPFDPVYNFFGAILAFFYSIIPNLGVSIILLTVLVMLVLFPLTAKQAKAMMAMQRAQPEIKKLQAKYKNDRAKLNEEMMKFYQENKINPLAGCLPLLVQMPIFLTLFRVMREPYKHIPKSSDLYAAFCTGPHGKLHTLECNLPKQGCPTRSTSSGWTSRSTPPRSPAASSTRSPTSSSSAW